MKAFIIYDTPEHNLNLLYWGRFTAPDPFLAIKVGNKTIAFVSSLEYGRCKQTSRFNEVYLLSDVRKHFEKNAPFWLSFFKFLQRQFDVATFIVPDDFPASIYAQIVDQIPIEFDAAAFNQQRACKTDDEKAEIKKACQLASRTITFAKDILQTSDVKDGALFFDNQPLTSEALRGRMEIYCLEHGGYATDTIVAGGQDATNPHCVGHGVLRANQLIVIDFFPRLQHSHYYGDMTRTFIKGKASKEQADMYCCVQDCQRALIAQVKAGVLTSTLMAFATQFFEERGYGLKQSEQGYQGFIHSVGHGLGLNLHEYPSISTRPIRLEPGMVITIEPGLYFNEVGGVRIEDDVYVTEDGCELLSRCNYDFEL